MSALIGVAGWHNCTFAPSEVSGNLRHELPNNQVEQPGISPVLR
ncbi:hypothetical protein [Thalassolituus sp.]|jgi:hypothetical protein